MASLDNITYSRLVQILGGGQIFDHGSRVDLVALALFNWTMLPHAHMTVVPNVTEDSILLTIEPRENRTFLFDLADPEKRSEGDIKTLLATLKRFQAHGHVVLGMNEKESHQIFEVMGNEMHNYREKMAVRIKRKLKISTVLMHKPKMVVCTKKNETYCVDTPFTNTPQIKTGAGDHFNSGYSTRHILGLEPTDCLTLGVAFASYYVKPRSHLASLK